MLAQAASFMSSKRVGRLFTCNKMTGACQKGTAVKETSRLFCTGQATSNGAEGTRSTRTQAVFCQNISQREMKQGDSQVPSSIKIRIGHMVWAFVLWLCRMYEMSAGRCSMYVLSH